MTSVMHDPGAPPAVPTTLDAALADAEAAEAALETAADLLCQTAYGVWLVLHRATDAELQCELNERRGVTHCRSKMAHCPICDEH